MSVLRLAKLSYGVALLLISAVLTVSTWAFLNDEDRFGPEGIENAFAIWELPSLTTQDVIDTLQAQAREHHVNVYKAWPSVHNGVRQTDYYLFEGDAPRALGDRVSGEFPTFGGIYTGTLRDGSELNTEQTVGAYAVQGPSSARDAIADSLSAQGMHVTTSAVPGALLRWPLQVLGGPLGGTIVVAWLAALLAALNLIVVRMGIYAARASLGASRAALLASDAIAVSLAATVAAALPTLVIVAYSLIFAGGYRLSTALAMAPAQLLFVLAAPAIALGLQRFASRRLSIGKVVSGARPALTVASVATGAAVLAGVLSTTTAVLTLELGHEYAAEQRLSTFWQAHDELSVINRNYASVAADPDDLDHALAAVYRTAERENGVYLAQASALNGWGPPLESRSLVTNTALVRSLGVLSERELEAIEQQAKAPGGAALIIPSQLAAHQSAVTEQAHEWLAFQATLPGSIDNGAPDLTVIAQHDVGLVPRFDTTFGGIGPMYLEDPVLLVVDGESGLVSDDFYANSGAYLYPRSTWESLEATGGAMWVSTLTRLEQAATLKAAEDRADLWTASVGLAMMGIVLVAAWTLIASIYLSRERTRAFLMWTTGQSFIKTHSKFLVWACAAATVPTLGLLALSDLPLTPKFVIFAAQTACAVGAITLSLRLLGRQHNRAALFNS